MNYPRDGELYRRGGRQAALQDWPVGFTLRGAGGLHIKLGCRKGRSGGLPFSEPAPPFFAARRTAFLCSPPARPSLLSSVQPVDSSRFLFGNTALQPALPNLVVEESHVCFAVAEKNIVEVLVSLENFVVGFVDKVVVANYLYYCNWTRQTHCFNDFEMSSCDGNLYS